MSAHQLKSHSQNSDLQSPYACVEYVTCARPPLEDARRVFNHKDKNFFVKFFCAVKKWILKISSAAAAPGG